MCSIEYNPREQNFRADMLLKLASTKAMESKLVTQEAIVEPSINEIASG